MMANYIDREAAVELLTSVALEVSDSKRRAVAKCINEIALMPAADVEPVRHGYWRYGGLDVMGVTVECSCCGWGLRNVDSVLWQDYPAHQFCGRCGAKMDLEGESNDD